MRFVLIGCVVLSMGCRSQGETVSGAAAPVGETMEGAKNRPPRVGTWKTQWVEEHTLTGELIRRVPPTPEPDFSILILDAVGHYADTNLPLSTLKTKRIDRLTPEEAGEIFVRKAPNRSPSSFFGTYTAFGQDGPDRLVIEHLRGGINARETGPGKEHLRLQELVGNRAHMKRLPLTGPNLMTWRVFERVPPLAQLTPMHHRFIGFWKPLSNERQKPTGEVVSNIPIESGTIVYTSSGYVEVHLQRPNHKKWASSVPTPTEAKATFDTYTAYAAPYTINEAKQMVTHVGVGPISAQDGPDALYSYEFSEGGRLILKSPPQTVDGLQVRTVIVAERVSGDNPSDQP